MSTLSIHKRPFREPLTPQIEKYSAEARPQSRPSRALAMASVWRESISAVVVDSSHSKAQKYFASSLAMLILR
jgi:hypothetical protein